MGRIFGILKTLLASAPLTLTGGNFQASQSRRRPRIAAIVSEYRRYSHAQHILDRFLWGYGWGNQHHHPAMDLVSVYVDQQPKNDLSRRRSKEFGFPIVFDATHSVQMPGGGGDKSSGHGEFAPVLARSAVAAGADGLFIETHPEPEKAWSDGPNMIPLRDMSKVLKQLVKVRAAVQ